MSILVLTSDTLIGTPATGNLEYNGQFFGTDSNASRAQLQRITSGTAVASTSGTSIDFTGLPAWVKRITVIIKGMSTSGTSNPVIQLGSGSVTTTGYLTSTWQANTTNANNTNGFVIRGTTTAALVQSGNLIINLLGSNIYVASGIFSQTGGADSIIVGGDITLSGALDRVRITTTNGTDTFDAGSVNILIEG